MLRGASLGKQDAATAGAHREKKKMGKFRADLSFKCGKCIAPITSGHAGSPQLSVLATGGRSQGQGKCRAQCRAHGSSLGNVPKRCWLRHWCRAGNRRHVPSPPHRAAKAHGRASVSVCPGLHLLLAFGQPRPWPGSPPSSTSHRCCPRPPSPAEPHACSRTMPQHRR